MSDPLTVIDLENIHKCLMACIERSAFLPEEIPTVVKLTDKLQKTVHQYQLQVASSSEAPSSTKKTKPRKETK